jgi:hypothetical protein
MKTLTRILLPITLFSLLFFTQCLNEPCTSDVEGFFSDTVLNLSAVNSEFDDYNSSGPPTISYSLPLLFSSNRYTLGKKYDLINFDLWLVFDQESMKLTLNAIEGQSYPFNYLSNYANSTYDEFGPYTSYLSGQDFLFLFASNRTGNMDMYYIYYNSVSAGGLSSINPSPIPLKALNSPKYEAYATLSVALKQVILASNRDGDIDLYRLRFPESTDYLGWAMGDSIYAPERLAVLNSDSTDMFPYINGNTLVFASKRAGGFGGYDLYYSLYNGTEWGQPTNFGPTINTVSDEFRPVAFQAPYFKNDLLIFSSNRPGGKGGIDLYYVGISKLK